MACVPFLFLFLLFSVLPIKGAAYSQAEPGVKSCWYPDSEGFSEHANCLEPRERELLRIKQPHLSRLQFIGDLAAVFNNEHGWMYVNKKGEVVVAGVTSVDNGPDEFHEGLVRYERNHKCGYATSEGSGTIVPQFDGCMPFENGKAHVCKGCRKERVNSSSEYHELKGGKWFCIDIQGKRVACSP